MTSCLRTILVSLIVLAPLAACSNLPTLPAEPSSYRLGAGDTLEIKVLGADELNGRYSVQDDGTVKMLLIDSVPAANLTPNQLENEIDQKLAAGQYLKQPKVSVVLSQYRPFFIMGEIPVPGAYPYVPGMKVLTAAAAAGGYTRRASQDYVIITRNGQDYRADPMTPIQPGDIISVPASTLESAL